MVTQSTYIEIRVSTEFENIEPMAALLFDIGMESSWEESEELIGYFEESLFDHQKIENIVAQFPFKTFSFQQMKPKNWNEEWEKNFEPVLVDNRLFIRGSMHQSKPDVDFEIVINPKMSFGTGHHATTNMMSKAILDHDFKGKSCMDAGCGTAVLAILAEKKGAFPIDAFDVEDWTCENAKENLIENNCNITKVQCGTILEVELLNQYDIILANINKNVLVAEMPHYANKLKQNGLLFLSGFYQKDIEDIEKKAKENNLFIYKQDNIDNWACLYLENK